MKQPQRIAVSGASGFLGSALVASLQQAGDEVLRLVRRQAGHGEIYWDPDAGRIDGAALAGLDAVVHLAGENIAGFWTPAKKRRIMESRVRGTRLLAAALADLKVPPRTLVSASAVGYYGSAGDAILTEDAPAGEDFLARVCIGWEDAVTPAAKAGIRTVSTRFGLLLDKRGGALRMMRPAFKLGLGARLGSGQQWMSWISLADAVRVLRFALDTERLSGAVNAVAPEPVRNEEFTQKLARALNRPARFVAPRAPVQMLTGGMAEALLFASQRAVPAKLTERGFHFGQPTLETTLRFGG